MGERTAEMVARGLAPARVSWEGSWGCRGPSSCGVPPRGSGNGGPDVCSIVRRGRRGGSRPRAHEPGLGIFEGRTQGGPQNGRSGQPSCRVWRRGICGGRWGRRAEKQRMLRQRKRCVEVLRAPCAAVCPCRSVTRADPVPAGEAFCTPALPPRGGGRAQRRCSERSVKAERGAAVPLLQKFGFTGGFPPSRAPAAPPRGPATRRITLPPAARPEFTARMTSGPATNGWRGGAGSSGPHNGRARGHMSPIRARRRHCPLTRPRPWLGSPCSKRAPKRPAVSGDQGRRGGLGTVRARPGRKRVRGGGARTCRGAR